MLRLRYAIAASRCGGAGATHGAHITGVRLMPLCRARESLRAMRLVYYAMVTTCYASGRVDAAAMPDAYATRDADAAAMFLPLPYATRAVVFPRY